MEDGKPSATYTYDVTKLNDQGLNQMRLELGDTSVENGRFSSALCDQEYEAMIKRESSWRKAKYKCVCAIVSRLSYQVDYSVKSMSFSLSKRLEEWKKIKSDMESGFQTPSASFLKPENAGDGQHYFRLGLHHNPGHDRGDH